MGLFDFVKDVGRQVFNTDSEAADNIKQHLEIKTSGISNLTVEYDDGGGGLSFNTIMIGIFVLLVIVIVVLKVLGIGGKKEE